MKLLAFLLGIIHFFVLINFSQCGSNSLPTTEKPPIVSKVVTPSNEATAGQPAEVVGEGDATEAAPKRRRRRRRTTAAPTTATMPTTTLSPEEDEPYTGKPPRMTTKPAKAKASTKRPENMAKALTTTTLKPNTTTRKATTAKTVTVTKAATTTLNPTTIAKAVKDAKIIATTTIKPTTATTKKAASTPKTVSESHKKKQKEHDKHHHHHHHADHGIVNEAVSTINQRGSVNNIISTASLQLKHDKKGKRKDPDEDYEEYSEEEEMYDYEDK